MTKSADMYMYDTRLKSNPGYIGGRQVLSVLCQPYSPISKHWILVLTRHCSYLMIKRMNSFTDVHCEDVNIHIHVRQNI